MPLILVIDDHPLLREAVLSAVQTALGQTEIREAGSLKEARASASASAPPDMVILDLVLPDSSGLDTLKAMRSSFPRVPILLFTAATDAKMAAEALALGAAGYVPKSAPKPLLVEAITEVFRGGTYVPVRLDGLMRNGQSLRPVREDMAGRIPALTGAEIRVLQLVRRGLLNKQIAHALHIGETTVKAHVTAILRKLNVISRTQIVIETAHPDIDALLKKKAAETGPGAKPGLR